ncbi:cadmium-translocating P-type ATPase [Vibrio sp. SS-MA-C1-2]|uniref:heavy metal translocating P-type ATPase n=1 Tax=Vibrio sp. SS-MA-C1-2 TaxID=2908646 RepID=UPI001F23B38E|nr:heavy metal translocating P-type ATPase [Vibrio sp. SS-MA-C1-2]UJF18110.1 cadmium-translocating P-type ATPase [Vibrio sp. SS-MA-C1-2]
MSKDCYHCAEPIPKGFQQSIEILGEEREMCCIGCHAVATTIVESGLTSYYQYRTETATKTDLIPDELNNLIHYDHEEVQLDFVRNNQNLKEVTLSLEGVSCAACAWLIEKQLFNVSGIQFVGVNTATHRAIIRWDPEKIKLSDILRRIQQIGYKAAPFEANQQEQLYHKQMKQYLYRLGIAGIATMQVMMLAVALYFELFSDLDQEFKAYLRWISLIFATPVLLYSAQPFYINAWRNLKARTLGMDVPVSIALLIAYFSSVIATMTEQGEVYFESVSMFTFFLLMGRYLEMRARRKAAAASANLLKLIPSMAQLEDGSKIAAKTLIIGQRVIVKPGENFPADGIIIQGDTSVDESMLTGESVHINKIVNDPVFAGTINGDGNVTVEVTETTQQSLVSKIIQLQDEAQLSKPQVATLADNISRYFVAIILVISLGTWLYWHFHHPEDAFWIMLSVLVATCPCALSLATPTAITCSTSSMGELGILLRKGHVLETLCKVNRLVIDKTGTLTEGNIKLVDTELFSHYSQQQALAIAAGLERFANHPIANTFTPYYSQQIQFQQVNNEIGLGLNGQLDNDHWRIGRLEYAIEPSYLDELKAKHQQAEMQVWLSCNGEPVAQFILQDPIRSESAEFIAQCQQQGITVTMLTGDSSHAAQSVAKKLNIDELVSGVSPQQKLAYLQNLPKDQVSLMVGDGVNDAPVLAGAHLSVAMGGGTDIAKSSADMILLGDDLLKLLKAKKLAQFSRKIIRQNLAWALGYNITILPLACAGLVIPYIAVIGMSLSSLLVVSNSLRLLKGKS